MSEHPKTEKPKKESAYKDSLLLPKTNFPMQAGLAQKEPATQAAWATQNLLNRMLEKNRKGGKPPFVFHDGPPYANGHIHLGHVLNKVLKDFVVKFKNLKGHPSDFTPGWDCHGLPIELQVVKKLGKERQNLSLSQFRDACRAYAEDFVKIQNEEFQKLSILAQWQAPYLTMNFSYQAAIIRELSVLAKKGYVYRDKKPIHWCISCSTALAEAEIEYENHVSPSIYVNFIIEEDLGKWCTEAAGKKIGLPIWTTTPWTLPANLAVTVHPQFDYVFVETPQRGIMIVAEGLMPQFLKGIDQENAKVLGKIKGKVLEGLTYKSPINRRIGRVILGEYVTLEQGSGNVHTAPGHGQDDYINGLKNHLEIFAPVNQYGKYTDEVPEFAGMKVFDANDKIIASLKASGILLGEAKLEHSYPHCWRCKHPVIFRATPQWFVSLEHENLRQKTLAEIERVQWIPLWGKERIHNMIAHRPDWCLSRQRTWGVPIPAIYCEACEEAILEPHAMETLAVQVEKKGANVWYEEQVEAFLPSGFFCPKCQGRKFRKEKDILDVWFDSGVSYAAVGKEFSMGFPVDLYLEGSDQHRGWFHSSLLTAMMTRDRAPYKAVLTHGFVVDGKKRKMSKSAGNYISAQDAVKKYGGEVLRLWVSAEDYRDDIRISDEIMQRLSDAYRKIRNTMRFLLGGLSDFKPDTQLVAIEDMQQVDRFILDRFDRLLEKINHAYEVYEFHVIYHGLYQFCTVDLSSIYLDMMKDRLYCEHATDPLRRSAQSAMFLIARKMCTAMAPILSVTSEEVWRELPDWKDKAESVFLDDFPTLQPQWRDDLLFETFRNFLKVREDIAKGLEIARQQKLLGQSLEARVILQSEAAVKKVLQPFEQDLPFYFIVSQVDWVDANPEGLVTHVGESEFKTKLAVARAAYEKCQRCWNYRKDVGVSSKFSDVCGRCASVLEK